jgi:hypothetical protein
MLSGEQDISKKVLYFIHFVWGWSWRANSIYSSDGATAKFYTTRYPGGTEPAVKHAMKTFSEDLR